MSPRVAMGFGVADNFGLHYVWWVPRLPHLWGRRKIAFVWASVVFWKSLKASALHWRLPFSGHHIRIPRVISVCLPVVGGCGPVGTS